MPVTKLEASSTGKLSFAARLTAFQIVDHSVNGLAWRFGIYHPFQLFATFAPMFHEILQPQKMHFTPYHHITIPFGHTNKMPFEKLAASLPLRRLRKFRIEKFLTFAIELDARFRRLWTPLVFGCKFYGGFVMLNVHEAARSTSTNADATIR